MIKQVLEQTTTRKLAFHIKNVVKKQHPNIYKLVNVIKKEVVITQMRMATFESGATFPLGRKNKEKEKGIQTLLECFKKEISV